MPSTPEFFLAALFNIVILPGSGYFFFRKWKKGILFSALSLILAALTVVGGIAGWHSLISFSLFLGGFVIAIFSTIDAYRIYKSSGKK